MGNVKKSWSGSLLLLNGVSRRWFVNTIGMVLAILIVFITILSFTVQSYVYNSINQVLKGRMAELPNALATKPGGYSTASEFNSTMRDYVENFPDKNSMEMMVINRHGQVMTTSTGFAPSEDQQMKDYQSAIRNEFDYGYWVGPLDTGEKVMAITRVVKDNNDELLGSIRYLVSMERADWQITLIILVLISVGVLIMLFIFLSGLYFIRSIVVPVRQVSRSARQIAQGDFDVRIEKSNDDEIGQLCDAINDMASELAASETMKNDFISSVSHELRTPLTAIKGWAETLQDDVDPGTEKKGINVIIRESERLSGLVEELLDFSRLQSGHLRLNLQKVDILAELDDAIYLFTERARSEGKKLCYEENTALSVILGDVDRLRQIFINVIDNALKYTESDGTIHIMSKEKDGYVEVTITDDGCGIPALHLPNVKKKFYKANQTVRGSGIGLAIADEIVLLHAGKLDVQSQEDIGTVVRITLPTLETLEQDPELAIIPEMKKMLERNLDPNE